jgi:hypothetical protein
LLFGKYQGNIDAAIGSFKSNGYTLTEEEDVFAFLGVEVKKDVDSGKVTLIQKGLIQKLIKYCEMEDCNYKSTPAGSVPLSHDIHGEPFDENWGYANAVGMAMYLASNSRPDIQFAVHQCARFTHCPKKSHAMGMKRICRYLAGTMDKGLMYMPDKGMKLDCYVDADFAGLWGAEDSQSPLSVKSRTGYMLTLGNCPLVWVSKLQSLIALSTLESEYIALSQSMREVLPMRELLSEIGAKQNLDFAKPCITHSTIFEDNNGALTLASSPRITPRTKHIAVKYHFFRSRVGKGIELAKIDTKEQVADMFTKGLKQDTFCYLRKKLCGW